jgi:hypothetical protein
VKKSIAQGKTRRPPRPPTTEQLRILAEEPPTDTRIAFLTDAYAKLATERMPAFAGVWPLPVGKIEDFFERRGLSREAVELATDTIMLVDQQIRSRPPPTPPRPRK